MRARVRARYELLKCQGTQNLWSNYCTIHLCSAHTKQHYDYFELTGGGGRWEGGWRRTGGHCHISCHFVTIVIDHHQCKNPHLWKGSRGGKAGGGRKVPGDLLLQSHVQPGTKPLCVCASRLARSSHENSFFWQFFVYNIWYYATLVCLLSPPIFSHETY